MKKLSVVLIAVLIAILLPAPSSAHQFQSYAGIGIYFNCVNGGMPGGTAAIGAQWSTVSRRTGFAYFVVPVGTYDVFYNGAYAGTVRANMNKTIRRLVSC